MKVGGVENVKDVIYGPLVFDRGKNQDGNDILLAFYAKPIWSFDEFNEICPLPENTNWRFEKGGKTLDDEAPAWRELIRQHDIKRWGWYVLKSLEPSEIQYETVDPEDPETWGNVEDELKSELSMYEFAALMDLVNEANSIDQRKLDINRETFLRRQVQPTSAPVQSGEVKSTPSLEPA